MKAKVKVHGMDRVKVSLQNIAAKVTAGARKQMRQSADEIVRVARIQVPVDTYNLEKAIKVVEEIGSRRRTEIVIGVQPSGDEVNRDGKPIDVNDYAAIIHENYEQYEPGRRTVKKRAEYPGYYIGSGFLTRAAEAEEPKLEKQMIKTVARIITEENA